MNTINLCLPGKLFQFILIVARRIL